MSEAPGAWIPGAKGLGTGSLQRISRLRRFFQFEPKKTKYPGKSYHLLVLLFWNTLFLENSKIETTLYFWFSTHFNQFCWYIIRNQNEILLFLVVDCYAQAYLFLFPGLANLLDVVPLHQNEVSARLMPRGVENQSTEKLFAFASRMSNQILVTPKSSIWVVPKIGVPPKASILIGFSIIINHPFWGTPIFGNTQFIPSFWSYLRRYFVFRLLEQALSFPTFFISEQNITGLHNQWAWNKKNLPKTNSSAPKK